MNQLIKSEETQVKYEKNCKQATADSPVEFGLPSALISLSQIAKECECDVSTLEYRLNYINQKIPDVVEIAPGSTNAKGCQLLLELEFSLSRGANMSDIINSWQNNSDFLESAVPTEIVAPHTKIKALGGQPDSFIDHYQESVRLEKLVKEDYIKNNTDIGKHLPDAIRQKLEDFFAYDQRLGGYPLLEFVARKGWGLTSRDFQALIDFCPNKKRHEFDCFAFIRSRAKVRVSRNSISRTTGKSKPARKSVYVWRVVMLEPIEEESEEVEILEPPLNVPKTSLTYKSRKLLTTQKK